MDILDTAMARTVRDAKLESREARAKLGDFLVLAYKNFTEVRHLFNRDFVPRLREHFASLRGGEEVGVGFRLGDF